MNKTRSDAFSEKISPEQKAQLIDWLSDHSYTETSELVAAPPPDGFGLQTSEAALCRFYKAHFAEIEKCRQEKFTHRAIGQLEYATVQESHYREVLAESANLFLQERFYEALTRPLESIDELKKLVVVATKMKELGLTIDPDAEQKEAIAVERHNEFLRLLRATENPPAPSSPREQPPLAPISGT